ncbi:hypothetical protein [Pseudobacillus badius]|uniref:hypothetical protein n=1 Tax=Bacillus badius TaxID=1455 RepID=UPI0007B32630|nr:hypothetical protein [Bacillus badius]KZR58360.1 phage head-tail adapter protein [Bacillus badius]
MAQKAYRETFNDGFLQYGYKQTKRSETGKRLGEIFTAEGRLAFKEVTCRDQDYQMAGIMSASLDLKVKTLYPPSFRRINKSKLKVVIDEKEFDVIKADPDNSKRYLHFYLQKVGAST